MSRSGVGKSPRTQAKGVLNVVGGDKCGEGGRKYCDKSIPLLTCTPEKHKRSLWGSCTCGRVHGRVDNTAVWSSLLTKQGAVREQSRAYSPSFTHIVVPSAVTFAKRPLSICSASLFPRVCRGAFRDRCACLYLPFCTHHDG
jgi:hypothetical protein